MAYADLSDEDKLRQAIKFVAIGQPLPDAITLFLREADLYELIVNPSTFEDNDDPTGSVNSPGK